MSLTSFRQAVQDELQKDLGITFVAGMLTAAANDRTIGCVWAAGIREGSDINTEEIVLHARVFTQFEATQGYKQGDIDQLEQLAEQLQTALRDKQATLGPWFFRVTEVELLIEEHGVQATIVAVDDNLFAAGG